MPQASRLVSRRRNERGQPTASAEASRTIPTLWSKIGDC